jgi:Hydrophobic surface binding protein A
MRLSALLCIGLTATSVSASPLAASASGTLNRRDLPAVQAAFDQVGKAIDKMIESVDAFDGDATKLLPILETSLAIAKMNSDGAKTVAASKTMGLTDAISLVPMTSALQEKVAKVVASLANKKEALEKAGAKDAVLDQMMQQRKSADELAAAILGNLPMPALTGPIAGPIAATITNTLDGGITAWGGTPPPSSSGKNRLQIPI